ncbi:NADH-quinone oxidoreductase subunit M [Acidihalobacter prosperus]|uniref:NADH-quinone oxidoreductase subunit M n=1 Tax=Acidihalobacter prosperus TaxID=160660 RepID=A0A1A6C718_9GAMM|nr:NADH-quinone oxidoreductase subunit M [Acidihalobacter prosperus]OBS10356.1 NADH-ubiquinone oxidoreductase chain M [Acidihalobacter prosperus]
MLTHWPLLSLVIWLPVLGGIVLMATSGGSERLTKQLALVISVLAFIVSIPLLTNFNTHTAAMQFVEFHPWIRMLNINYHLGVDGLSAPLIVLTTFMTVIVVIAGWEVIDRHVAQYMAAFLVLEGLMNGVFAALDSILFYIFFEGMLIPMFLVIGIWGGPRRVYATIKFFLYTFLGSVPMLIALIYLYTRSGSFGIAELQQLHIGLTAQILIFLAFMGAFAVKIPMWPVHTWLPDAHVEAPTGGSIILAAIMLKVGAYGFLRFSLPIVPDASQMLSGVLIFMSLVAIVYIGFVALAQQDMKKLIAYSSIAHMGFVTLGFFSIYAVIANSGVSQAALLGLEGGLVQMVSHGFISGALFLSVGVLYDRMHSREISAYGGVVNTMPVFAGFFVLFAMANTGLPGTSGFVGEFMVILASFHANFWYALLAAFTLIIGAAYTLWLVKRVIFGPVANQEVAALKDVNRRERLMLTLLALAVLLLGIWPAPLLDIMHVSMQHLLQQALASKL